MHFKPSTQETEVDRSLIRCRLAWSTLVSTRAVELQRDPASKTNLQRCTYFCMVFCLHICMHTTCCTEHLLGRPEEGIKSSPTGVSDGFQSLCGWIGN